MKQLEFDFNARKGLVDIIEEYEEFKKFDKVWDAVRYAEKNEPKKGIRIKNRFYIPKNKRELQAQLCSMYPKSAYTILGMNSKQAMKAYLCIMYYRTKMEDKIMELKLL